MQVRELQVALAQTRRDAMSRQEPEPEPEQQTDAVKVVVERERTEAEDTASYAGELSYQAGGKGPFKAVWAELVGPQLCLRAERAMAPTLLSIDLTGCAVAMPKKVRCYY